MERKPYLLAATDMTEGIIDKQLKIQTWKWGGGKLRLDWAAFRPDDEGEPLSEVLPPLMDVRPCEIEGEGVADLQGLKTTADFIVRAGVP